MAGGVSMADFMVVEDPRMHHNIDDQAPYPNRQLQTLFDPSVQLEEYMYYARLSRAFEGKNYGKGSDYQKYHQGALARHIPGMAAAQAKLPFTKKEAPPDGNSHVDDPALDEKVPASETAAELGLNIRKKSEGNIVISEEEWVRASRATRTATWSAIVYLTTTDILGPFSTPYAFSQLGWGPGAVLYTVFGALAGYSGWQIYRMFLQLDSDRYPLKGYGDLGFRVYGGWMRHIINVFQSLQLFMNVGIIMLSNAQSLEQLAAGKDGTGHICFIVCVLIAMIAGFVVGQIRTLARFGWLANLAVWLNVLTMFFVMGVAAHSEPNWKAVCQTSPETCPNWSQAEDGSGPHIPPPIEHHGGLPTGVSLTDNITGLMQGVYSYGGATLFCQFLSEMRRPWDFWKALIVADVFIWAMYMLFGMFVYGYQGQGSYNPAYQGVNPYGWQTVGNVFQLITSVIAACLYGNIGIKVLYINVFQEIFHFPPLEVFKGKVIWAVLVPIYWITAFVVSCSIPQFTNFSALVAAAFILQFTYTFPPLLAVAFRSQRDAILPGETFDPNTGEVRRQDYGFSRWWRGYSKKLLLNTWDVIYFLGAFVTAVLGIYSAITNMVHAYANAPALTSWNCKGATG